MTDVSVVVPTHNRGQLLMTTLRSVLWQHAVDIEVIVVDDGSIDNTPQVIRAMDDGRLRVVRNEVPQRVSAARNRGAVMARSDWVAFCDDDDLWAPDKIARQLEAAVRAGRPWVYCGTVNIDQHLRIVSGRPPPDPEHVMATLGRFNPIPGGGSNVMMRRDALEAAGPFDTQLANTEDWEMWLRLAAQQGPPAWVCAPLVAYRVHGGNASLDTEQILAGIARIEQQHGNRVDRGVIHRWFAESFLRTGRRSRALRHWTLAATHGQALAVAGDLATIARRRAGRLSRRTSDPLASPTGVWAAQPTEWLTKLRDGLRPPCE
ncbi:MAG: glycosyltransferase [Nitriliruptorales bacterium]|nr:glycosyltransferase [Nitriliruptorales bacterium]